MVNGPSKLVAGALNLCLVLPAVVMLYAVIAAPVASAEADCDVPASNTPNIDGVSFLIIFFFFSFIFF
mgnify:CR=1 FL=1